MNIPFITFACLSDCAVHAARLARSSELLPMERVVGSVITVDGLMGVAAPAADGKMSLA